jgi:hypothetical protein
VVQMCVRQHQIVDRLRIHWQWLEIPLAELLCALKNTAIDQQPFAACFDKIFRSSDGSCRAKKSELCHRPAILNDTGE